MRLAALLADHLLNFVAPALWLAVAMLPLGHWLAPGPARLAWPARLALHAGAGVAVLAIGLVVGGQDGRIATWAALALVAGSLEWALRSRPAATPVQDAAAPIAAPPATPPVRTDPPGP